MKDRWIIMLVIVILVLATVTIILLDETEIDDSINYIEQSLAIMIFLLNFIGSRSI